MTTIKVSDARPEPTALPTSQASNRHLGKSLRPAAAETLYVVPAPPNVEPSGTGTVADPFRLSAGAEYGLNRLIRQSMDARRPLDVQFGDGLYKNVRLQIIREGTDSQTLYLRERIQGDSTPTGTITYHDSTQCNREGENCRVQAADFAIGPKACAPLTLRAEHAGAAIFDGADLGGSPQVEDTALLISGAVFGAPSGTCTDSDSPRIRQVYVDGLAFRGYRNGIQVTYGEEIVVASCSLDDLGNRSPRHHDSLLFGTFGLRVDGDSRSVLFRDNVVRSVWNAVFNDGSPAAQADPGLIHAIYQGYAVDVVFKHNQFIGCSGPMVKFGLYPLIRDNKIICQFPQSPRERCTVFIGNTFILEPILSNGHKVPIYGPSQAFIHENSMSEFEHGFTAPASGAIFLDNQFENRLSIDVRAPVIFLRQELPSSAKGLNLPGWFFSGNIIRGVATPDLAAVRRRGSPMNVDALVRIGPEDPVVAPLVAQANGSSAALLGKAVMTATLRSVVAALSGPHDPEADARLLALCGDTS